MKKTHSTDCICFSCINSFEDSYEFRELEQKLKKNQENLLINQDKKELKIAVKELHAYMNGNKPTIKLSFDLINKNGAKIGVTREVQASMLIGDVTSHVDKLAKLIIDSNDLY
ncbi:hypothetical protein [Bacillus toyonensis]|uniref:hypothetical protein n=1 Tax=Bacillus toyonensis TaxID=155322 RepID=UPI0002795651|nr:hypothetical protein [Bacillus toyonensis]EJQ77800.1 hypothetical protein IGO_05619 [Bacillus toyonensis]